jgi:hypothetical protein
VAPHSTCNDHRQLAKLVNGQTGAPHDAFERLRYDRVVPWDGHLPLPVAEDDMPALADNMESHLLQGAHRVLMIHAVNARDG